MMDNKNFIWENDRFRKDPYKVPDGYFSDFPDRMMDRLGRLADDLPSKRHRNVKPWLIWISGIAAALIIGWVGIRTYYVKPLQEVRFQENIALFVDYYGDELHEGQLAGYFEDNKIDVSVAAPEVDALIQIDPDLAEEYIYQSVGF
jgi:hypothetical protein